MALRKHFSDVFKLSNLLNNMACDRISTPSASSVCKKINGHEQVKNSEQRHKVLSSLNRNLFPVTRVNLNFFGVNNKSLNVSERENATHIYKCPSSLTHRFSNLVILDKHIKTDYHLPLANSIIAPLVDPQSQIRTEEIKDPVPSVHQPLKEAKEILKIRHKKMKKHKLKKLRKRMYFLWRKQKMARKAKRDTAYRKEISEIKKDGEDFEAEVFVKEQLEKARRGGYFINVFNSKA